MLVILPYLSSYLLVSDPNDAFMSLSSTPPGLLPASNSNTPEGHWQTDVEIFGYHTDAYHWTLGNIVIALLIESCYQRCPPVPVRIV
jgi:hypothetical protein